MNCMFFFMELRGSVNNVVWSFATGLSQSYVAYVDSVTLHSELRCCGLSKQCVVFLDTYCLDVRDTSRFPERVICSVQQTLRASYRRFAKRRVAAGTLDRQTRRALAVCLNLPRDGHALAIRPARPRSFSRTHQPTLPFHSATAPARRFAPSRYPGRRWVCDLEIIEPRSDDFIADYFTTEEQGLVARASAVDRLRLVALLGAVRRACSKPCTRGCDSIRVV